MTLQFISQQQITHFVSTETISSQYKYSYLNRKEARKRQKKGEEIEKENDLFRGKL